MRKRLIVAALAATALVVAAGSAVAAVSTTSVVVTPSSPDWASVTESGVASGSFTSVAGSPSGSGAYRFQTDGGGQLLAGAVHSGMKVSDIDALSFSSYSVAGTSVVAPSLQIGWDPNLDDGDMVWKGRLVGYYNPAPTADTWIEWNTLSQFSWFFTNAAGDPADLGCTLAAPCTWAEVVSAYPDGGISQGHFGNNAPIGFLGLKAGSGEGVTDRYADKLSITAGGSTTTYDFEPVTTCATSTTGTTITLQADCSVTAPFVVPGGYTLDGNGKTITAAQGGLFDGGIVANASGQTMTVKNLTIVGRNLGLNCGVALAGIRLVGAGGEIDNVYVHGLYQTEGDHISGCQVGHGIEVDARGVASPVSVTIKDSEIVDYQKTGMLVRGDVHATITGNLVDGFGTDQFATSYIASNGIQISYGASATINGNTIKDNYYMPKSYSSAGLITYKAKGITTGLANSMKDIFVANKFTGNEQDMIGGRGGNPV